MKQEEKGNNDKFFQSIIHQTNEGGFFMYYHIGEVFQIKDGKMFGTPYGVKSVKKITSENFHHKVCVE